MSKKFYVLSALLALGFSANAQVFEQEGGMSRQVPQNTRPSSGQSAGQSSSHGVGLGMHPYSPQLLHSLKNCQKYKDEDVIESNGLKANYVAEVLGRNGNICRFRMSLSMDAGEMSLSCAFNPTNLAKYVNIVAKASKMKDPKKELSQQDAADLQNILTDEKVCAVKMVFDATKEIRDNLTKCTPYQKVIDTGASRMSFYIRGKQNSQCIFQYVVERDMPDIRSGKDSDKLVPTKAYYECKLSGYNVEELKRAFEKERIVTNSVEEAMNSEGGNIDELLGQYLDSGICDITDIKQ